MLIIASMMQKNIIVTIDELLEEAQNAPKKLVINKNALSLQSGAKKSVLRGRGMEFFESRPYVHQDEIRHIDWKVSAKRAGIFTKVFMEEKERPVYLIIDQRSNMFFGSKVCFKSVLAAKIAANLAFCAINTKDKLGGFIITDEEEIECPIKASSTSLAKFLGQIAMATTKALSIRHAKTQTNNSFKNIFQRILLKAHPGCVVFIISDFWQFDDDLKPLLFKLKKRATIYALNITDPLEQSLPSLGIASIAFDEQKITFDASNKDLQKSYENFYQNRIKNLTKLFDSLGIILWNFSTQDDYKTNLKLGFKAK